MATPASADRAEAGNRVEVAGTIEAPVAAARAVLLDLEAFDAWFPGLDSWQVLDRSPEAARVHGRQAFPWPVSDRDYVVRYRWWDREDGGFALEAVGIPGAEPAPDPGVVRVDRLRSLWTLEPEGSRTRATYLYEGPSAGRLLDWLASLGASGRTRDVIDGLAGEVARRR